MENHADVKIEDVKIEDAINREDQQRNLDVPLPIPLMPCIIYIITDDCCNIKKKKEEFIVVLVDPSHDAIP